MEATSPNLGNAVPVQPVAATGDDRSVAAKLRELPVWASVLVVLLALGGASAFAWHVWNGSPPVDRELDVGTMPNARAPRFAIRPAQPVSMDADGIYPAGGNLTRVKSGDFYMNLPPQPITKLPLLV